MKSHWKCRLGLMTTSVLATAMLASGVQPAMVYAETPASATTASMDGFNFQATVLDRSGKTLAGKKVSLYDITDGNRNLVQNVTTNENGLASFSNLPLNRNLSVFIDGIAQGYTTRTSESGQVRSSAFYVDGQGTNTPKYSDKMITIGILDEEGEPIANQKVTLTNPLKEVIGEAMTDANGNVVFKDKLLEGVRYTYSVNGNTIDATQPDTTRYVSLRPDQILTDKNQNSSQKEGFTFVATVLGNNGKTLAGKKVSLYDITDGNRNLVQNVTTNENGLASFSNLPLNRNLSVFIDDIAQGYTTRTSENGQVRSSAFYVDGQGTNTPKYSDKMITIGVLDEEGEPIANQKVTLTNPLKEVIGEAMTDANGNVVFKDKLLEGVRYTYSVNGNTIDATQPDTTRYVSLRPDQILKAKEQDSPQQGDKSPAPTNTPQKEAVANKTAEKQENSKEDKQNSPQKEAAKHALPLTAEKGYQALTVLGLTILLGAVAIFFQGKGQKK